MIPDPFRSYLNEELLSPGVYDLVSQHQRLYVYSQEDVDIEIQKKIKTQIKNGNMVIISGFFASHRDLVRSISVGFSKYNLLLNDKNYFNILGKVLRASLRQFGGKQSHTFIDISRKSLSLLDQIKDAKIINDESFNTLRSLVESLIPYSHLVSEFVFELYGANIYYQVEKTAYTSLVLPRRIHYDIHVQPFPYKFSNCSFIKSFSNLDPFAHRLWGIGPSLSEALINYIARNDIDPDILESLFSSSSVNPKIEAFAKEELPAKHQSLSSIDKLIFLVGLEIYKTNQSYELKYLSYGADDLILMNTRHVAHKPMHGSSAFSAEYILNQADRCLNFIY